MCKKVMTVVFFTIILVILGLCALGDGNSIVTPAYVEFNDMPGDTMVMTNEEAYITSVVQDLTEMVRTNVTDVVDLSNNVLTVKGTSLDLNITESTNFTTSAKELSLGYESNKRFAASELATTNSAGLMSKEDKVNLRDALSALDNKLSVTGGVITGNLTIDTPGLLKVNNDIDNLNGFVKTMGLEILDTGAHCYFGTSGDDQMLHIITARDIDGQSTGTYGNVAIPRKVGTLALIEDLPSLGMTNDVLWVNGQHTNIVVRYANGAVDLGTRKDNTTVGNYSIALGSQGTASDSYTIAAGHMTTASKPGAHAQGYSTTANGNYSHSEGYGSRSSGQYSHAEGYQTTSAGYHSHADGYRAVTAQYGSGDKITNKHDYAYAWQGDSSGTYYHSHGEGTFNINPTNGISGFYIGETNLTTYLSGYATTNEVELSERIEFSPWTILRDGADVTAQIITPPGFDGYGWEVRNSHIPSDYTLETYLVGTANDTSLSWVADNSEYNMAYYTATRTAFPYYHLGSQTNKPLPSLTIATNNSANILRIESNKYDVVIGYTNNHFVAFAANNKLHDSGKDASDFVGKTLDKSNNKTAVTIGSRKDITLSHYGANSVAIGGQIDARSDYVLAQGDHSKIATGDNYSVALGKYASVAQNHGSSFVWQGVNTNTYYESNGNGTFNINPVGGTSGFYIGATNLNTYLSKYSPTNEVALTIKEFSGWSCDPAQIEVDGTVWDSPYGIDWWGDAEQGFEEGWYCANMEQGAGPYWLSSDINATNLEWSVWGTPIVATRSPLRYQLGSQLDKQIPSFAMVKNIQEQVSNMSLVGKLYNTENPVDFTNAVWDIVRALGGSVTNFPVSNP